MDANIATDLFIGIVCFGGLLGLVIVVAVAYIAVNILRYVSRGVRFHD